MSATERILIAQRDRQIGAINRLANVLGDTNLDAPRFHEKFNSMNVPKLNDMDEPLSPFERLCILAKELDAVRAGKSRKWDENETAANKGDKK